MTDPFFEHIRDDSSYIHRSIRRGVKHAVIEAIISLVGPKPRRSVYATAFSVRHQAALLTHESIENRVDLDLEKVVFVEEDSEVTREMGRLIDSVFISTMSWTSPAVERFIAKVAPLLDTHLAGSVTDLALERCLIDAAMEGR